MYTTCAKKEVQVNQAPQTERSDLRAAHENDCTLPSQAQASNCYNNKIGRDVLLRALLLPLLQTANLTATRTQELSALMGEDELAARAHHAEACAPSGHRFHAAVPRQAQKCAVIGLQLDHAAAAAAHNLQQAVAGGAFRIRLERRCAVGCKSQELPVARLPAQCKRFRARCNARRLVECETYKENARGSSALGGSVTLAATLGSGGPAAAAAARFETEVRECFVADSGVLLVDT